MQEVKRGASAEIAGLEKRRSAIEKELANLTNAVALTGGSPAVMDQIVKREREREEISSKLAVIGRGAFEDRVDSGSSSPPGCPRFRIYWRPTPTKPRRSLPGTPRPSC
jgi:hypothetical protein